jgi:hypothetical protein
MENSFDTPVCKGKIVMPDNERVIVMGEVLVPTKSNVLKYISSAPYDSISSFSGSGLPFPNSKVAFENNPNKGVVPILNNQFKFNLLRPNSFYEDFNKLKPPNVILKIDDNEVHVELPYSKVAYRSLQYPPARNQPSFYNIKQPIRSQEKVLRDSEYNVYEEHPNFWGLRPPI